MGNYYPRVVMKMFLLIDFLMGFGRPLNTVALEYLIIADVYRLFLFARTYSKH